MMSKQTYGSYEKVSLKIEDRPNGRVAFVSVDNPKQANALSPIVIANMLQAFEDLAVDDQLRAVVLGGGGKGFSAGADISAMKTMNSQSGRAFITSLHGIINRIRTMPVPVIGQLHGYCFGGALEMVAVCDFRVGDESLVIGMPEVKVGIPSVIEAALLPNIIGWGKTREMLLTGANYNASEAYEMGLLQRLTKPGKMAEVVEEWLEHILESGPLAVRSQKALMAKWEKISLSDGIAEGINHFADSFQTSEPNDMLALRLKK